MIKRSQLASMLFLVMVTICPVGATIPRQAGPTLTVTPSSVIIKVGESANVSLALSNSPPGFGQVCFGVEDFPTSGFITSFDPSCVTPEYSNLAVLTVEATPAAAPQNFTAYVVATSGTWTERIPINITVEPAMSVWIPWSIILAFILALLVPIIIKKKQRQPTSTPLS